MARGSHTLGSVHHAPASSFTRGTLLIALGLGLAACEVGPGGGGGGGDDEGTADAAVDAPPPDYTVAVTPAAATTLGTAITLTVDLTSSDFAGPVALTASGAPASWAVTIDPPTVTLADGGTAQATVRISVPTNGDAAPAGQGLTILGQGAPGARAATATVTVDNVYVLAIGTPGAGGAHFASIAGGQLRMKRGAHLQLPNTDTIAHRIHSDAALPGFPHQPASMGPGGMYEVTLASTGSDLFYCHDHGQGTGQVRLTVE